MLNLFCSFLCIRSKLSIQNTCELTKNENSMKYHKKEGELLVMNYTLEDMIIDDYFNQRPVTVLWHLSLFSISNKKYLFQSRSMSWVGGIWKILPFYRWCINCINMSTNVHTLVKEVCSCTTCIISHISSLREEISLEYTSLYFCML